MTPPFFAIAFIWSSFKFLLCGQRFHTLLCEAMIGFFVYLITSQKVCSPLWLMSISIPISFILSTILIPRSVSPLCGSESFFVVSSAAEVAQLVELFHVNVKYLVPLAYN